MKHMMYEPIDDVLRITGMSLEELKQFDEDYGIIAKWNNGVLKIALVDLIWTLRLAGYLNVSAIGKDDIAFHEYLRK